MSQKLDDEDHKSVTASQSEATKTLISFYKTKCKDGTRGRSFICIDDDDESYNEE